MTVDKVANMRIAALEKKLTAVIKTNTKIQLQVEEHLDKVDKALDKLRKALPHVNFEG